MRPKRECKERITIKHLHWEISQLKLEVKKQGEMIMNALQRAQASELALKNSIDAALALVQNVPNNDVALNALADDMDAQKVKIDAAVAALNTPPAA